MQQNSATPTAITKIAFDGTVERRRKLVLCVWGGGGTKISSQKASLTHS